MKNATRHRGRPNALRDPQDKRARLQLELPDSIQDALDRIGQNLGVATRAEIIRRAISYLDVLVTESKAGSRIEIVDSRGERRQLVVF